MSKANLNFKELNFKEFKPTNNGELVQNTHYSLSYSEQHEQADWVFYEIKKGFLGWLIEQMILEGINW